MWKIGVGGMVISQAEKSAVMKVLDSGRLTYGEYSRTFEEQFSRMHQCQFGVLSNSGTSSLEVAVATLKEVHHWSDGDEIIVPATTFVASVNVILMCGLKPVLVDIEPTYYELDVAQIEAKITPRTRCIMVVHLFGQPCDMDPILEIASKHNLRIIEDSCETMFATYRGRSVGSFGDIACFSMYMAHILCTGVGGIATTNNPEYAVIMRSLVNHGRDNIYIAMDDDRGCVDGVRKQIIERRFNFIRLGYSYRITEMEAAIGVAQLDQIDNNIPRRQAIASQYTKGLEKFQSLIQLPAIRAGTTHVFMMYPIVVATDRFTKSELVNHLECQNIETRDTLPLINQPFYQGNVIVSQNHYPVSKWLIERGFYIGSHPALSDDNVDYIIRTLSTFFERYVTWS